MSQRALLLHYKCKFCWSCRSKISEHVLNIQVGECPYAVSLDIEEKWGFYKQGTPSINTSATGFDLCRFMKS